MRTVSRYGLLILITLQCGMMPTSFADSWRNTWLGRVGSFVCASNGTRSMCWNYGGSGGAQALHEADNDYLAYFSGELLISYPNPGKGGVLCSVIFGGHCAVVLDSGAVVYADLPSLTYPAITSTAVLTDPRETLRKQKGVIALHGTRLGECSDEALRADDMELEALDGDGHPRHLHIDFSFNENEHLVQGASGRCELHKSATESYSNYSAYPEMHAISGKHPLDFKVCANVYRPVMTPVLKYDPHFEGTNLTFHLDEFADATLLCAKGYVETSGKVSILGERPAGTPADLEYERETSDPRIGAPNRPFETDPDKTMRYRDSIDGATCTYADARIECLAEDGHSLPVPVLKDEAPTGPPRLAAFLKSLQFEAIPAGTLRINADHVIQVAAMEIMQTQLTRGMRSLLFGSIPPGPDCAPGTEAGFSDCPNFAYQANPFAVADLLAHLNAVDPSFVYELPTQIQWLRAASQGQKIGYDTDQDDFLFTFSPKLGFAASDHHGAGDLVKDKYAPGMTCWNQFASGSAENGREAFCPIDSPEYNELDRGTFTPTGRYYHGGQDDSTLRLVRYPNETP